MQNERRQTQAFCCCVFRKNPSGKRKCTLTPPRLFDLVTDTWRSRAIIVFMLLYIFNQISSVALFFLGFQDPAEEVSSIISRPNNTDTSAPISSSLNVTAPIADSPPPGVIQDDVKLVAEIVVLGVTLFFTLPATAGVSSYQSVFIAMFSAAIVGARMGWQLAGIQTDLIQYLSMLANPLDAPLNMSKEWPAVLLKVIKESVGYLSISILFLLFVIHIIRNFWFGNAFDYDKQRLDNFYLFVRELVTPIKRKPKAKRPWYALCCCCINARSTKKSKRDYEVVDDDIDYFKDTPSDSDAQEMDSPLGRRRSLSSSRASLLQSKKTLSAKGIVAALKSSFKRLFQSIRDWFIDLFAPQEPEVHTLFERSEHFRFPARILVTLVVSISIVLLVAVIMAIKFWTYSNKFVVEAPKFGFDAEDAEFYRKEILWIGVAGSVVSYFIIRTICNWLLTLRNYKHLIFKLRRGKYPFNRTHYNPFWATTYIGYQISHCVGGFILVLFAVGIIIAVGHLLVSNEDARMFVWSFIRVSGATWLVRWIINRFLIFFFTSWDGRVIRFRTLFQFLDLIVLFLDTLTGLFTVIIRVLLGAGLVLINFSRLDIPIFPQGWHRYDGAYSTYIATVLMDHYHNNPIKLVFADQLWQAVRNKKALIESAPKFVESGAAAEETALLIDPAAGSVEFEADASVSEEKRRRIRNKWRLLVLMARNPSIAKYRKQR